MSISPLHSTETTLAPASLPQHLAIIMDGNGRWAAQRRLPRIAGHRKGAEVVRNVVEACVQAKIPYLTLFAFSSENWRRPPAEVQLLMMLFREMLRREVKRLHKNDIRLRVIGDLSAFDEKLQELICQAEALTAQNQTMTLTIAANYGGRWDILQAARRFAAGAVAGELDAAVLDEDAFASYLCLAGYPEPDLFIRTGGEQRISNFLLWHLAYTELFFTDVLWPDFDQAVFDQALLSFSGRQRRFGKTGEQMAAGE